MSVKYSIIQLNSPSKSVPNLDTRHNKAFSLDPISATPREFPHHAPIKKDASSYFMPKPLGKKKAEVKERSYLLPVLVNVSQKRNETFRSFVIEEDLKNEERDKKLKVLDMKLKKTAELNDVNFQQHSRLKVLDFLKKKSKGTMYMSELWNSALYSEVLKTSGLGTVLDKIRSSRYQPRDAVVKKLERMYKDKHPTRADDNYSIELPSLTSRDIPSTKIDTMGSITEENDRILSREPKSARNPLSISELNSELTVRKKINLPKITGISADFGSLSARNYVPSLNEDKALMSDRTLDTNDLPRFGHCMNSPSIFKSSRRITEKIENDSLDNFVRNKYDIKLKNILKKCEGAVDGHANILKDVSKLKKMFNQPTPRQQALIQKRKDEISSQIRAALRHEYHKGH